MVGWLKGHWFLLTALVAVSAAWGEQRIRVEGLLDREQAQLHINEKVQSLAEQSARVDERTKAIKESQERQESLLRLILEKVK